MSSCSTTGSRSRTCCAEVSPASLLDRELDEQPAALAQAAEHVRPLHAGPEEAVAATKTYVNSLAAIALLSAALAHDERRLEQLREMPMRVAAQLERTRADAVSLDTYAASDSATV